MCGANPYPNLIYTATQNIYKRGNSIKTKTTKTDEKELRAINRPISRSKDRFNNSSLRKPIKRGQ